jgi:hypothetical protein
VPALPRGDASVGLDSRNARRTISRMSTPRRDEPKGWREPTQRDRRIGFAIGIVVCAVLVGFVIYLLDKLG